MLPKRGMYASSHRPPAYVLDSLVKVSRTLGPVALARSFRETALEFMNGAPHWGHAELAMWLLGPYVRCTRYAAERAPSGEISPPVLLRDVDARFVDRALRVAHASVFDVLRGEVEDGKVGTFASEMAAAGFVVRCEDDRGPDGWLPTMKPRRLAERVLSLFAADYLIRPAAFEAELSVCSACKSVAFESPRGCARCCRRHRTSGVFENVTSLFPEGA